MEDVTDVVFRQIVRECGAPDVFFTEFTNAAGMFSSGRDKVISRLKKLDIEGTEESPLIAQIWGITPDNYYQAAKDISSMGFTGIDINMGCPVRKITKQGACSALIDNPSLAGEIIQATKEGSSLPVSVKTRIGFKSDKTEEWGSFLLEQGIDALTIHGRLAKDASKYPSDWNAVKQVVELRDQIAPDTVIIGNGDVMSLDDVALRHDQAGVDGVMIGRGIFADPFVFNPSRSLLDLSPQEKIDLMLRHATLYEETWGRNKSFKILRRFFKIYIKDIDGAAELRSKLMETENLDDVTAIINA